MCGYGVCRAYMLGGVCAGYGVCRANMLYVWCVLRMCVICVSCTRRVYTIYLILLN